LNMNTRRGQTCFHGEVNRFEIDKFWDGWRLNLELAKSEYSNRLSWIKR
jgi:hypothetical protein